MKCFGKIRTSVATWWWDAMIHLGVGSSGPPVLSFNWDLFWKMVSMADNQEAFISRFVLAWAGYDGSVLFGTTNRFEVIVPADDTKQSVKSLFLHLFDKHFGIQLEPHNQILAKSEIENGKDIVKIRIWNKDHLRKLGKKLFPIAQEWKKNPRRNYLSYDRYENLEQFAKL